MKVVTKIEQYEKEFEKLTEIFKDVEPGKQKLVEGLISDASFLYAENWDIRNIIDKSGGMVKVNPKNLSMQKQTEAGKQYLKNINSYSVIIKTLNGILMKNTIEGEDPFDQWIREKKEKNEQE